MRPRRESTQAGGLVCSYLVWDLGGPRTLLLLHGFLDQAHSFGPLVNALHDAGLAGRTVVAPDLRGHGHSDWVPEGAHYHFPDYIHDMMDLLDDLGAVEEVEVLGHSMGGSVAGYLAGTDPARFRRVVLVEGLGPFSRPFSAGPEQMRAWIEKTRSIEPPRRLPSVESATERLLAGNHRLPPERARDFAAAAVREVDGGVVWRFDPRHRAPSAVPFHWERLEPFLRAIACPVLVVDGAEAGRWDGREGRLSALADGEHHEVAGAGHMVHHDAPEALARLVAPWLEK